MLKYNKYKSLLTILLFIFVLVACSTKKDTLVSRNWHALNSQYNTIYNGDLALELGIKELNQNYTDNFWTILPIERMYVDPERELNNQNTKNQNFARAEDKAVKAIQKHAINIDGKERNMQMDEAHLLLGKARYYDKRFIPALEAFNYILYKYSNSDKISEAKVWREKTNLRLENDGLAIKNLSLLLKRNDLNSQIYANAQATLAQAYINLEDYTKATKPLLIATQYTNNKEQQARYTYILGQLYQKLNFSDSAFASYQKVIDMKRKSPRLYIIQAHAQQASLLSNTIDSTVFLKKYYKLIKDRENKPFLDILNHQVALYYDKTQVYNKAISYYHKSLRSNGGDTYLAASNYRNIAKIYFDQEKYEAAGKYYDSTLTKLKIKDKEYLSIEKKRNNLQDVIVFENKVKKCDSILKLVAMSASERENYFETYIKNQSKKDSIHRLKNKEQQKKEENRNQNNALNTQTGNTDLKPTNIDFIDYKNIFYFYNSATVAYGRIEFTKRWGKRPLVDNWRITNQILTNDVNQMLNTTQNNTSENDVSIENFHKSNVKKYLTSIPTATKTIDSLSNEKNIANYNLGVLYKEKFIERDRAISRFEMVLTNHPSEKLILPTQYNLYQLYKGIDIHKTETLKTQILVNYPNTHYATLIKENRVDVETNNEPIQIYNTVYNQFTNNELQHLIPALNKYIQLYQGNDIVPKLELLKAHTQGKLLGVQAYKESVNHVFKTYPNTEEAKQAQTLLSTTIPYLEKLELVNDSISTKWKVLYHVGNKNENTTLKLQSKIESFLKENQYTQYKISFDIYTPSQNFLVIHGIGSIEYARYIIQLLSKTKKYNIKENANVISSENYTVVQAKKNLDEYIKQQLKL